MPKKMRDQSVPPERFTMRPPSIVYWGLLNVDSSLNGKTQQAQARSLLQSKLAQKEGSLRNRVNDLCRIHDKDPNAVWDGLFMGKSLDDLGIPTTTAPAPDLEDE